MIETDEILLIPKGRTKDAMNHLWPNRGAGWAEHLPHNLKSIPLAPRPPAVIRRPPTPPQSIEINPCNNAFNNCMLRVSGAGGGGAQGRWRQ